MKPSRSKPPRLRTKAIFVDLEYTLIRYTRPGRVDPSAKIRALVTDAVARKRKIDASEAEKLLQAIPEAELWTPKAEKSLGIDIGEIRTKLRSWLSSRIEGDQEAKATLEAFRRSGLRLWTATTNAGFLGAIKLDAVGLAYDAKGDPLFEEVRGGSEVHPFGKVTSGFFTNLLQHAGLHPDDVLHIGHSHIWDCDVPRGAGIRKTILLDRDLPERFVEGENGEIYVQSWSVIRQMVELDR